MVAFVAILVSILGLMGLKIQALTKEKNLTDLAKDTEELSKQVQEHKEKVETDEKKLDDMLSRYDNNGNKTTH